MQRHFLGLLEPSTHYTIIQPLAIFLILYFFIFFCPPSFTFIKVLSKYIMQRLDIFPLIQTSTIAEADTVQNNWNNLTLSFKLGLLKLFPFKIPFSLRNVTQASATGSISDSWHSLDWFGLGRGWTMPSDTQDLTAGSVQWWLLEEFRGLRVAPAIIPGSVVCKASALPIVLLLQPLMLVF